MPLPCVSIELDDLMSSSHSKKAQSHVTSVRVHTIQYSVYLYILVYIHMSIYVLSVCVCVLIEMRPENSDQNGNGCRLATCACHTARRACDSTFSNKRYDAFGCPSVGHNDDVLSYVHE